MQKPFDKLLMYADHGVKIFDGRRFRYPLPEHVMAGLEVLDFSNAPEWLVQKVPFDGPVGHQMVIQYEGEVSYAKLPRGKKWYRVANDRPDPIMR